VDDLALAAWGRCLVVIVLDGHVVSPAGSSLTPRATIQSVPSGSGRCSFKTSSGGAVIQVSTSSGVVRITGIALGWMAPTSAFGSVVRVEIVGGFAFLDLPDGGPVSPDAGEAAKGTRLVERELDIAAFA
jgi:hypothetical protein